MKTTKDVIKEIAEIKEVVTTQSLKPSVSAALVNRIPILNECLMYLETNPSEEFVASEIERIEKKINNRMLDFALPEDKVSKKEYSTLRTAHENKHEIPRLRTQVKMLRYLLNSD